LKLVKLDKPGDFAHESTVMGHSVRGYEPHKFADETHPDWVPESEKGMTEARFSSGHPNYGPRRLGRDQARGRGDSVAAGLEGDESCDGGDSQGSVCGRG
jgi:hypothetical protein